MRERSRQLGCVSLTMVKGLRVCLTVIKGESRNQNQP